jgi:hypothetical protein
MLQDGGSDGTKTRPFAPPPNREPHPEVRKARESDSTFFTGKKQVTQLSLENLGPCRAVMRAAGQSYSISGKWLELLKQIAPRVTRVAILWDPTTPTGPAQFGAIQALAASLSLQVNSFNKLHPGEGRSPASPVAGTMGPVKPQVCKQSSRTALSRSAHRTL